MSAADHLRAEAGLLAEALPALLAEAEHLAATVALGEHGRRRAGQGDDFWQYRPAHAGDPVRAIDWRRSARSDAHYLREREWMAAQAVSLWVDPGRSMVFSGARDRVTKQHRAQVLALALASLLLRGGERVGLAGEGAPPRPGKAQMLPLASGLLAARSDADYAAPQALGLVPHGRAVFLSDFLADPAPLESALAQAADRGVKGVLLQVLDPVEEEFPYAGRTIFESMGGTARHETLEAGELKDRYLARLHERRDRLARMAQAVGWHMEVHSTGQGAMTALLWAFMVLKGGQG